MAAEFLISDDNIHRNLDEDPIPLNARRYNLSNDQPEWPVFRSFEDRETRIREFLHSEYSKLLLNVNKESDGRCYQSLHNPVDYEETEILDHSPPDTEVEESSPTIPLNSLVRERSEPTSARVHFQEAPESDLTSPHRDVAIESFRTTSRPSNSVPSDPERYDSKETNADTEPGEKISDQRFEDGTGIRTRVFSSKPLGSIRGSRYASLQERAKTTGESSSVDEEETEAESETSSANCYIISEVSAIPNITNLEDEEDSELCQPPAETITKFPLDTSSENCQPVASGTISDLPLEDGSEAQQYSPNQDSDSELEIPVLEPQPTPNQLDYRSQDEHGTESTLVRARVIADTFADTDNMKQAETRLSPGVSAVRPGAHPRVQLDKNIVRFTGEVDPWFIPARGDILITHPRTLAEDTIKPYTPWLKVPAEDIPEVPSPPDSYRSENGSQVGHPRTGCLKVWNGLYTHKIDEFMKNGDLLLRIGTWRVNHLDQDKNSLNDHHQWPPDHGYSYFPYYRVDLYSVRKLRPSNKYVFLGYQHPLKLGGRIPSGEFHSPGQYLNPGAPCPVSFVPAVGDVIIQKDAFKMKFDHKQNFRRSMVKWFKRSMSISVLHGPVEQRTEITIGTFLLRPYVGRVALDSECMGFGKMDGGGVELFRYESEGWVFWGRERLLVELGSRLPREIPILFVSDPGLEEDNPNFPSPLILGS